MAAPPDRQHADTTIRLELRALEKMAAALCRHTDRLWREARHRQEPVTREAEFQWQAFEERRKEVVRLMKEPVREPDTARIARLERLVEALEVSRSYFKARNRTD